MTDQTPASLIDEYNRLKDHCTAQSKVFADYIKPFKDRMDEIENLLLAKLNLDKCDSVKTEHGTAYKSTLTNVKIVNREALLDFANENWDKVGNALLMISAQKDAVKTWMEEHDGSPPPGVETSFFTRVNIRRS